MKTKIFNTILFSLMTLTSIFAQKVNPMIVTVSATQPTCYGGNNGSISLTPNGGLAPYTYLWSGGQTGQTISNLTAGQYSVTITDAMGQVVGGVFTLPQPQEITINAIQTNVSSPGAGNGAIDITTVSGTNGNWNFLWSSTNNSYNPSSLDQTNLLPGNYKLTVIDEAGCESIRNFIITQPLIFKPKLSNNLQSSISVFPNPSNGDITIDIESDKSYTITNLNTGTEVQSGKSNGELINVNNLPSGNYLISTESGEMKRVTIL